MPHSNEQFRLFGHLPIELRRYIWLLCLPHRTIELDYAEPGSYDYGCAHICGDYGHMQKTTEENCQPPLLLAACRESRQVALEYGREVKFGRWALWLQPRLDQFVMWRGDLDSSSLFTMSPDHSNPSAIFRPDRQLSNVFGWAKQYGLAPCITLSFIEPFTTSYKKFESPWPLSEAHVAEVALIAQSARNTHLAVSVKMMTLHITREHAAQSGLFGVFAEEPVQLVDAYDHQRLCMYHRLWLQHSNDQSEDPTKVFKGIVDNDLAEKLDQWIERASWIVLAASWLAARSGLFSNTESPQGVWVPEVLEHSLPSYEANRVNSAHPWVRQALETIPHLQPKIEIRACWKTACLKMHGACLSRPSTPVYEYSPAYYSPEYHQFRPGSKNWTGQMRRKEAREREKKGLD